MPENPEPLVIMVIVAATVGAVIGVIPFGRPVHPVFLIFDMMVFSAWIVAGIAFVWHKFRQKH